MIQPDQIIEQTRDWIQRVVIGLNLCPFAQRPFDNATIRFSLSMAISDENLLHDLAQELDLLERDRSIETTLLIHPYILNDFYDYNDFLSLADALLVEMDLEGVFQIASFHPHYQFEGTKPEDVENYTNKSPYPMLHILREESLDRAIDSYPDVEDIPLRNQERMREMGIDGLKKLF